MTTPSTSQLIGSSPRGRGTHGRGGRVGRSVRIIPARAGNATTSGRSTATRSDHPRAGGERQHHAVQMRAEAGSSPRGRGTLRCRSASGRSIRIIPARAGNASGTTRRGRRRPDHPRAGGERSTWMYPLAAIPGSSPRGRGTLGLRAPAPVEHRIIPARAGNAGDRLHVLRQETDHPRAGGERLPRG